MDKQPEELFIGGALVHFDPPAHLEIPLQGGTLMLDRRGIRFEATDSAQSWQLTKQDLQTIRDHVLMDRSVRPGASPNQRIHCTRHAGMKCQICMCATCTPQSCIRPGQDCPDCFKEEPK